MGEGIVWKVVSEYNFVLGHIRSLHNFTMRKEIAACPREFFYYLGIFVDRLSSENSLAEALLVRRT